MSRKLTIEEVKRRLYEIHGDVVVLDESTYVDMSTKAKFIDKDYGEWWCTPNNMLCKKQSHSARQQEKVKQTCLKKYGCECSLQNKEVQEKRKQTWLENYGCTNPAQNKDIKEKIKQANIEKYGFEHPAQNKDIKEKVKQTCLKKYGCECSLQNKEVQEKRKQTFMKNYGCEHHWQNRDIQEKRKQTFMKNYGCENVSQNPQVAQKSARSQRNSTILKHWKTGQDVVCVASYEPKVVEYLNKNKIDYDWQIKFDMPNGKKYFIDAYLKDRDIYIEVKGYMREKSKAKWDWFHKEHPNSELWDTQKLKELKIL
jgi:hypothetical protein